MSIEEFDDLMEKASNEGAKVHVVDVDDIEYTGKACYYTKADDEENGYATFCIEPEGEEPFGIAANEIKSLEILSED